MGYFDSLPTLAEQSAARQGRIAKPEPRKRAKARKNRKKSLNRRYVRRRVFDRDCFMCRCCLVRAAETMHEIVPRSLGGVVSMQNSIALCGDGVRGCHGFCQRHEITVTPAHGDGPVDANQAAVFTAQTDAAREHLGRPFTRSSPPDQMRAVLDDARVGGTIRQKPRGTYRKQSHVGATVTFR